MAQRPFHRDIDELVQRVVHMASLSRRAVHEGVQSLLDLDEALARQVLDRDREINRLDVEIESRALELIALHQPMAVDLRTLGACLKLVTYIARIGRYGYDCAKATLAMAGRPHIKKLVGIPLMREKSLAMLDTAVEAFRTRNADLARKVGPADDEVDALYDQIFRECVTYMIEDPKTIGACTQYVLVARHLERIGDNAEKIAEKTVYMVTGKNRLDPANLRAPRSDPKGPVGTSSRVP